MPASDQALSIQRCCLTCWLSAAGTAGSRAARLSKLWTAVQQGQGSTAAHAQLEKVAACTLELYLDRAQTLYGVCLRHLDWMRRHEKELHLHLQGTRNLVSLSWCSIFLPACAFSTQRARACMRSCSWGPSGTHTQARLLTMTKNSLGGPRRPVF